jgi:hypothetical protein
MMGDFERTVEMLLLYVPDWQMRKTTYLDYVLGATKYGHYLGRTRCTCCNSEIRALVTRRIWIQI